jgi:hypothetical protein
MTKEEKLRLIGLTRTALAEIECAHPQIRARADKSAAKFSPTNAEQFRNLGEIVWCLIATDAKTDAMRLLDALCEHNDEYYWMFDALASAFATRAWLHSNRKDSAKSLSDAKAALEWIERDPNPKPVTRSEVIATLKRFDEWINRADKEKGVVTAVHVLSHALRVLVIYQQLAKAGCSAAKSIPSREYNTRISAGLIKLRHRIDAWEIRTGARPR